MCFYFKSSKTFISKCNAKLYLLKRGQSIAFFNSLIGVDIILYLFIISDKIILCSHAEIFILHGFQINYQNMTKYFLFPLLLFFSQLSFTQILVSTQKPLETQELRFSPDHANGGYYSDFIENITFIPLEYSKNSKVQYNPQILILDSTIIVSNLWGRIAEHELLFYNKDGRFIKKVDNIQKLSPEFKTISNISEIHADKDYLYLKVFIPGLQEPINTIKLNHQGLLVGTDNIESDEFMRVGDFTLIHNTQGEFNTAALTLLTKSSSLDTLIKYDVGIELGDNESMYGIDQAISYNGEKIYFTAPYNYKFYQYSKTLQLEKAYNLILPLKNSLPNDSIRQVFTEEYLKNNPDVIIGINHIQPIDDKLIIQLNSASSPRSAFIYNTISSDWINLKSLVPDSSSYQLPILEQINNHKIFTNGQDIYTLLYPSVVNNYLHNNKLTDVLKDEKVAILLKEFNPILVKFNLKK